MSLPSCTALINPAAVSQSAATEYVNLKTGVILPFIVNLKTALPYILFTEAFSMFSI